MHRLALGAALASFASALSTAAQVHVFVDDDAEPGGDGLSWATAFNEIRDGVQASINLGAARGQVRVAGGLYFTETAIELPNFRGTQHELAIVGGFAGLSDPADPDRRDPDAFLTEIDVLDGPEAVFEITSAGVLGPLAAGVPVSAINLGVATTFSGVAFMHDKAISADPGTAVYVDNCRFDFAQGKGPGGAIAAGRLNASIPPQVFDTMLRIVGSDFVECSASGLSLGGAVAAQNTSVFIQDSAFVACRADSGGALSLRACDAAVVDGIFDGNTAAHGDGGAIDSSFDLIPFALRLDGTHLQSNTASGRGGAVSGGVRMEGCTVVNNHADETGGGLFLVTRTLITDSLLAGNTAGDRSAADIQQVDSSGSPPTESRVELLRTRVLGQDSVEPSRPSVRIADPSRTPILRDTLIEGGLLLEDPSLARLLRSTFVSAFSGTPALSATVRGFVSVTSCAFAGPVPVRLDGSATLTASNTLVTGGAAAIDMGAMAGFSAVNLRANADPGFVSSDGPDGDPTTWQDNSYTPRLGSALIDAGGVMQPQPIIDTVPSLDLAGHPRIADDPGSPNIAPATPIDIGALEFQGESCLADVNRDGQVTAADFSAWVSAFEARDPLADQNGDGAIDPTDFSAWVGNFNASGC
jgi:hypothetical protein